LVTDFESMAKWWIWSKKYNVNVFYAAVVWSLWNLRNKLCFQGTVLGRNEKGDGKLCEVAAKLEPGEQLRRCSATGCLGVRAGGKKRKTGETPDDVEGMCSEQSACVVWSLIIGVVRMRT
jgi:hypothetical protein